MRLQFPVVAVLAPLAAQMIYGCTFSRTSGEEAGRADLRDGSCAEELNGKRTMETTPIGESACRHAIRIFKEVGPFNITVAHLTETTSPSAGGQSRYSASCLAEVSSSPISGSGAEALRARLST